MAKSAHIGVVEFAKQIDKTPQYVRRLIKQGKISKSSLKTEGKRKLIHPEKALVDLKNNVSYVNKKTPKAKQSETGTETGKRNQEDDGGTTQHRSVAAKGNTQELTLSQAQTWQARFRAALLKLELEEKSKKLVASERVERDAFAKARVVRDGILRVADRVAPQLAVIEDPHVIGDILKTALLTELEELST